MSAGGGGGGGGGVGAGGADCWVLPPAATAHTHTQQYFQQDGGCDEDSSSSWHTIGRASAAAVSMSVPSQAADQCYVPVVVLARWDRTERCRRAAGRATRQQPRFRVLSCSIVVLDMQQCFEAVLKSDCCGDGPIGFWKA